MHIIRSRKGAHITGSHALLSVGNLSSASSHQWEAYRWRYAFSHKTRHQPRRSSSRTQASRAAYSAGSTSFHLPTPLIRIRRRSGLIRNFIITPANRDEFIRELQERLVTKSG